MGIKPEKHIKLSETGTGLLSVLTGSALAGCLMAPLDIPPVLRAECEARLGAEMAALAQLGGQAPVSGARLRKEIEAAAVAGMSAADIAFCLDLPKPAVVDVLEDAGL